MQVFLTGATGFLGRRVLRELLAEGLHVRCVVRPSSDVDSLMSFVTDRSHRHCQEFNSDRLEIVAGNLSNEADCLELTRGCRVVYHVAAALGGCMSSLVTNTVVPTRALLNAASEQNVERFVLVSSLGVYGPQQLRRNTVLDEMCPLDAAPHLRDAYSYSKVLQEEVARETASTSGIPLVTVRPGVIYGDERGVLSHRVGLPLGGLLLRMGGRQKIPFTYVENCAAAVTLAGLAGDIGNQVINIVDNELPTGREVIRRYRKAGNRQRVIGIPQFTLNWLARFNEAYSRWSEQQIPPVLTRHRVQAMWKPLRYSNERARKLLGWEPRVSLDEAFNRTLSIPAGI